MRKTLPALAIGLGFLSMACSSIVSTLQPTFAPTIPSPMAQETVASAPTPCGTPSGPTAIRWFIGLHVGSEPERLENLRAFVE
jgi:hypothetical protein